MTKPERNIGILRNNLERAQDIIEDADVMLRDHHGMVAAHHAGLLGIKAVAENMAASLEGLIEENRCSQGDACVCGGDTAAVRAGCANWIK